MLGIDRKGRPSPGTDITDNLAAYGSNHFFGNSYLKVLSFTRAVYTTFFPHVIIQHFNVDKSGSPANDFLIFGKLRVHSWFYFVELHTNIVPNILFILCNIKNFGPRRDEVTGEWRRLHNEELNDLCCSPNIVRVIKWRRMRWAGHVARMGEERECIGCWWGNRRERDHWGDLGVDVWIILGWISRRWDVGIWTGLGWPRMETGGGRL